MLRTLDPGADVCGFVWSSPWFPLGHAGGSLGFVSLSGVNGLLQKPGCSHPLTKGVASPCSSLFELEPGHAVWCSRLTRGDSWEAPCAPRRKPHAQRPSRTPGPPHLPSPARPCLGGPSLPHPSLISASGEKFWRPNGASLLRMEPNATSLAASGS